MNFAVSKINQPYFYKNQPLSLNKNSKTSDIKSYNELSFLSKTSRINKAKIEAGMCREAELFSEFLEKEGKVTKEEYEDIKKNHPSFFLRAQKYCKNFYYGESSAYDAAQVALLADEYFKNNFKNYRIISLGTSPAPIAEQLAAMGHDVVFLPVSGLRNYNSKTDTLEELPELRAVMQYLDTKNIDDGKLNIVFDFTDSGSTLRAVARIIKKYFSLKNSKITKISINDDVIESAYTRSTEKYLHDAACCDVEQISNVPHFPVVSNEVARYDFIGKNDTLYLKNIAKQELFRQFDNYSSPLARAFSLCTMREIDKLVNNN